jgi:hypothetical protein
MRVSHFQLPVLSGAFYRQELNESVMSSTKRAAANRTAQAPAKKGRAMPPEVTGQAKALPEHEADGLVSAKHVAGNGDKLNLTSGHVTKKAEESKPTADHAQLFLKALFDGILPAVLDFPDITREQFEDLLRSSLRRMPPSQLKQSVLVESFQEHCDDMWRRYLIACGSPGLAQQHLSYCAFACCCVLISFV